MTLSYAQTSMQTTGIIKDEVIMTPPNECSTCLVTNPKEMKLGTYWKRIQNNSSKNIQESNKKTQINNLMKSGEQNKTKKKFNRDRKH